MKIILIPKSANAFTLFESLLTGIGSISLVVAVVLLFILWLKGWSNEKILSSTIQFGTMGFVLLGIRIFLLSGWRSKKTDGRESGK